MKKKYIRTAVIVSLLLLFCGSLLARLEVEPAGGSQLKTGESPTAESIAPAEERESREAHICTVEVRCDTVVDTSKLENEAVIPYIPADGVILPTT